MPGIPAGRTGTQGTALRCLADFDAWIVTRTAADLTEPFTFTVGTGGVLRVAPRRSEHVACAGGGPVLSAGEMSFVATQAGWVVDTVTNQSGEQVGVVGRHRDSGGRYILLVMPRRHLENFRARGVYSPALLVAMTRPMRHRNMSFSPWPDQETTERIAEAWNRPTMQAHFDDPRRWGYVPDPPPMEFERDGTRFYLAHFNANRAWYSAHPPPREPGADQL